MEFIFESNAAMQLKSNRFNNRAIGKGFVEKSTQNVFSRCEKCTNRISNHIEPFSLRLNIFEQIFISNTISIVLNESLCDFPLKAQLQCYKKSQK